MKKINFKRLGKKLLYTAEKYMPEALIIVGIGGMIGAGVMAVLATPEAEERIEAEMLCACCCNCGLGYYLHCRCSFREDETTCSPRGSLYGHRKDSSRVQEQGDRAYWRRSGARDRRCNCQR